MVKLNNELFCIVKRDEKECGLITILPFTIISIRFGM